MLPFHVVDVVWKSLNCKDQLLVALLDTGAANRHY